MAADTDWPWPDVTREDRDRRVGRSYRALCERIANGQVEDPEAALAALDRQWANYQVTWHVSQLTSPSPDDLLTPGEVAYWTTRSEKAVRMWFTRARNGGDGVHPIRTPEGLRVRWGDVLAYHQRLRNKTRKEHP